MPPVLIYQHMIKSQIYQSDWRSTSSPTVELEPVNIIDVYDNMQYVSQQRNKMIVIKEAQKAH